MAVAHGVDCAPASSSVAWLAPAVNDGAWFGPASTDSTIGAEPVQPFASVTVTVKLEVPDAPGVPARTPAGESVTAAGGEPAVMLQATGATPPVCVNVTGPYAVLA